jgi:hypothetical protein
MEKITNYINQHFEYFLNQYDISKYPPSIYNTAKDKFASLCPDEKIITNALLWKWGHLGKDNFPDKQRQLIRKVINLWPYFITSIDTSDPQTTFFWWSRNLKEGNLKRYITVTFITHLVHHQKIPIIDQHNFRALNYFSNNLIFSDSFKKNPSNWDDVIKLKQFMDNILTRLSNNNPEDLDKFLMMFGKSLKK